MNTQVNFGISLSGGGAKGIAHIGVLRCLLDNGIVPEVVSGTSAGSIIGALYAAGLSPDEIERFVDESSFYKIFRLVGLPTAGFVKMDYLRERLAAFIPEDNFGALKYPMYVCATNMNKGRPIIFSEGTLFDKVQASCAVPWLFKPVEIDGDLYCDGGITNNLPAECIRKKCTVLLGSNVKPKVHIEHNKELDSLMGITERTVDLSLWMNSKPHVKLLDVYIPHDKVMDFSFFNFNKTRELCDIGYEATLEKLPIIKDILEKKNSVLSLD